MALIKINLKVHAVYHGVAVCALAWWGNFSPVKGWSMVTDRHSAQGYILGYRVKQVLPKA